MAIRKRFWIPGVLLLLIAAAGVGFYLRPIEVFNARVDFQMWANGWRSNIVTVSGYKVHYFVVGPENGRPAVLVHGLGDKAETWRNLAPYLIYAGYRVYAPDLVGYGASEQPADFSYSIPEQAKIVAGFLDALGLQQVDLGGQSMGGWIVQTVAINHPERIRKLIIFDSVGLNVRPDWNTGLFTPKNAEELEGLKALLMPNPPPPSPEFITKDILRNFDKNAWVVHKSLAAMEDGDGDTTDARLPQLKMPVLLVWGDVDKITPLALGQKMHQLIPQSQLEVAQGCGHLAPQQCVPQIGPAIQKFLTQ